MERTIINRDYEVAAADVEYVNGIVEQLLDAPAAASAIEHDHWGEIRCEVSVRRFTDSKAQCVRWALVLDGDEYELRDYPNKREALSAFRTFVAKCAAEGVVWAETTIA
jgi:hypothetical protein